MKLSSRRAGEIMHQENMHNRQAAWRATEVSDWEFKLKPVTWLYGGNKVKGAWR